MNFFKKNITILILLALSLTGVPRQSARAAGILYVKETASGTGDCSSWANACTLQSALSAATSGDEIWVMAGTHKPTTGSSRTATFQLKSGVAVYGGFDGTETVRTDRDPAANITTLSGDINENDNGNVAHNEPTRADNSYHVVTGVTGATLDGLTITAGNANEGTETNSYGGGMYNVNSSPTLTNITFSRNSASMGGGMYNDNSNPTLTNLTFTNNYAGHGGGMNNNSSSPTLTNVTFSSNSASFYGGMNNTQDSSPTLTNVTFHANSASISGGGMYSSYRSNPTIYNTIFWGNTAPSMPEIGNEYLSTTAINNSIIQGGCPANITCTNVINSDPVLGTLGNNGGSTQTIPIQTGSSAFDASDSNCPATDQRGIARLQGAACDIGAYEMEVSTIFAIPDGATSGSCDSWANACELQYALNSATFGTEIWVKYGTYKPGSNRTDSFQLQPGVALYGGFTGTETERDQRTPSTNVTILSGDLNENDNSNIAHDEPTRADNSYHVVTGAGITGSARLDGFTITAGNANGGGATNGGGMYNSSSSPTLVNIAFSDNTALYRGGGMYNNSSSPTLTNITFSNNSADSGGGMYNNSSSPILTNITFSNNSASGGGGMYNNSSSPILTNITFSNNSASGGGGMYNLTGSNPTITNTTFSGNSANYGGGMYNVENSSLTLTNVTFSGNSANYGGGVMHSSSSSLILKNVIIANSTNGGDCVLTSGAILSSHNLIEDASNACGLANGVDGNIVGSDPLLGVLGDHGGSTETISLLAGSPALGGGDQAVCAAAPVNNLDQRGESRPQGDTACDIGAYEAVILSYDLRSAPKAISGFGKKDEVNTSHTTASDDDPALDSCGITGSGIATVWYTYVSTTNTAISIDTFGSDYNTFIAVWVNGTNGLELISCNDNSVGSTIGESQLAIRVEKDTTYYIEVGQP